MKSIILALFIVLFSISALANEPLNYEIDNLSEVTGYSDLTGQPAELEASGSYELSENYLDGNSIIQDSYSLIQENFEILPGHVLEILFSYGPENSYHVLFLPNRDCNCRSGKLTIRRS